MPGFSGIYSIPAKFIQMNKKKGLRLCKPLVFKEKNFVFLEKELFNNSAAIIQEVVLNEMLFCIVDFFYPMGLDLFLDLSLEKGF